MNRHDVYGRTCDEYRGIGLRNLHESKHSGWSSVWLNGSLNGGTMCRKGRGCCGWLDRFVLSAQLEGSES